MPDFAPIAATLRERVLAHYEQVGQRLEGQAGADTLETNSGYVERRASPLLEMLAAHGLPSIDGLRVVDVGCGFGALACYFAHRGASVVALDLNEPRLTVGREVAARHGLDVRFLPAPMQSTELKRESFDLAVQNNSLCYVVAPFEREAALKETLRILRKGGWLVVRNPNRWGPRDQFTGVPLLQLLPPRHAVDAARRLGRKRSLVRLTSPLQARRELSRAGFVHVRQAGFPGSRRPDALKVVASYHHFVARRPS
jgi:SAM-dependent methyltransferase